MTPSTAPENPPTAPTPIREDLDVEAIASPEESHPETAAGARATRKDRKADKEVKDAEAKVVEEAHRVEATKRAKEVLIAEKEAELRRQAESAVADDRAAGGPFRRGARRALKWLVALAVLGGLGVGAYFAWPPINERFFEKVETTAADVSAVQVDVASVQSQLADDSVALTDLAGRTQDVEAALATVESEIAAMADAQGTFATTQDELVASQSAVSAAQDDLSLRLDELDAMIDAQTGRLDGLDELATALGTDLASTNQGALQQLDVLKATELLSRARLLLYQANYGLAEADIATARATLAALDAPDADADRISQVIARLDLALFNLPDRPVAAAGDLDIAWQALLDGDAAAAGIAPAVPVPAADGAEPSAATNPSGFPESGSGSESGGTP